MAKHKYPSELNTQQVRVNLDDYAFLLHWSRLLKTTMAETLHLALDREGIKPHTRRGIELEPEKAEEFAEMIAEAADKVAEEAAEMADLADEADEDADEETVEMIEEAPEVLEEATGEVTR